MIPAIDKNVADWIEFFAKSVGILGGVFAVYKIFHEMAETRRQRAEELAWKRAEAAKKLNDEMLMDDGAKAAMVMLDWDDREFEIRSGVFATIDGDEHRRALRVSSGAYEEKEVYVRDCFDNLFYYLALFEHHIRNQLIRFEDVEFPIQYFVDLMSSHRFVYEEFARAYGYDRTLEFLKRFHSWNGQGGPTIIPGGRTPRPSQANRDGL
jgi:hypothetical protein